MIDHLVTLLLCSFLIIPICILISVGREMVNDPTYGFRTWGVTKAILPKRKQRTPIDDIWAAVEDMKSSRNKVRLLELDTMRHWEELCQCPDLEMLERERLRQERKEVQRVTDEYLGRPEYIPPPMQGFPRPLRNHVSSGGAEQTISIRGTDEEYRYITNLMSARRAHGRLHPMSPEPGLWQEPLLPSVPPGA